MIRTTEPRDKFLCKLDYIVRNVEMANWCLEENEKVEEEEAKQKEGNRKKA